MNKRFCKLGRNMLGALCVVSICGGISSCKDDYTLDNSNPTWLGSSIYEYLQQKGDYENFVKLIDDLKYAEVLGRTGSKTLFVANDSAFNVFYQNNIWGVHSYDELTLSQKKLLLNSAMINNAYLLEMMSSMPAGAGDDALPEKGQCLRRETATDVTDSIPHFLAEDLPVTYSLDDKDYWARFRDPKKGGIYMALDGTAPLMTHFLPAQMQNKMITDGDFEIIIGRPRGKNDAFIYDCKVLEQDITCQNGYINRLDKVLLTPQNMAELLRTNGQTNIFSHMIDRFSAPFYSSTLTERYRLLYGNEVDSVFQKRYFSNRSQGVSALKSDQGTDPLGNPSGNDVAYGLNFDPGWNGYAVDTKNQKKEQDMGVIFAPVDSRLMRYFFAADGGGRFLIEAFAPDYLDRIDENTTDMQLVYQALDCIPLDRIQALLNNLMKDSFCASVPSKFETIKNDAQDPMLDETHLDKIINVRLANNGAIYLMDEVITPAQYAAVSAPAYVAKDMRIFNWAIQRGSKNLGTSEDYLGNSKVDYYAYLLAMSARFSFFVPTDNNFWYIDPVSFQNPDKKTSSSGVELVGRIYNFTYNTTKETPAIASYQYIYNISTGEGRVGDLTTENVGVQKYGNALKDMLETHTIVHEDNTETTGIDETKSGVKPVDGVEQHYFVSKNGSVIYVENAGAANPVGKMTVKGGWQINNNESCNVIRFDDKTEGNGNGMAYELNTPIQPTIESAYSVLYNNADFKEFFELTQTDVEVLKTIGISKETEQAPYNIFVNSKGLPCYDKNTGNEVSKATNVRFFNNYRYTIYVPTNKAIEEAHNLGLPTWQQIRDLLELDVEPEERHELTPEEEDKRNEKAKAMASCIINFVKYHFQDNSVFADNPALKEKQYETATINSETGIYCKVAVKSAGNGTLTVTDATGKSRNITGNKNIVIRDYVLSNGTGSSNNNNIVSSSSAVVHGIDGVLNYKTLEGGRYDKDWNTPAKARNYLKKYQLLK